MLVQITEKEYDVVLDIRYATANNFTGKPIYKKPVCYLHPDAASALKKAISLAKEQGYRFKIFDGYRPFEVQQELWNNNPDPNFISNPQTGAIPHVRGVAVDLNLIDKDGNELSMGTRFDEFNEKSHLGRTDISKTEQANRYLLLGIMTTAGWDFYSKEWWHFQLFKPREYKALTDKEAGTGMY